MDEQDQERERKRAERRAAVAVRKAQAEEAKRIRDQQEAMLAYACRRIVYDDDAAPAELAFAVGTLDSIYNLDVVPDYVKRLNRAQDVQIAALAAEFRRRIDEAG